MNRNSYGALNSETEIDQKLIEQAISMALQAASKKKIPPTFDHMAARRINSRIGTKFIGHAVHHEIYDISNGGAKALVCVRAVEGSRYGQKTTSHDYYLIRRHGKGLRVIPANKAIAAKAAKAAGTNLGAAIAQCEAHPAH